MKKLLLFLCITLILGSCSSVKKNQEALNTGNYDSVIQSSLKQLQRGKDKKRKQPYIPLLEDAYAKVVARDINTISYLEKDQNPANYEKIFRTYQQLKSRQERIRPILPLFIVNENRNAVFEMKSYDTQIISYKNKVSEYLYTTSKNALESAHNKMEYRKVYEDLNYLNKINPNYKDVNRLIEVAHFKGTDFVIVNMKNKTDVIIPRRLEEDMLNFSTYGLDDLWTVYHSKAQSRIKYDYSMEVAFREINISPERVRERELSREKVITDGWEYLLDENGEVVIDKEGNKVKVDKTKTVRCTYYEFQQFKAANVVGNVQYRNLRTKQLLDAFPLSSEYVFEHIYANHSGDRRALEDELVRFLGLQAVPFPSNEQMVYDSGEDLKNKLKGIITRYRFN
ncbi:hypothetical protein ACFSTE_22255 [Aquimarina hainanensis]|uniref:Lipoprotein n=1 Tax=Aquimarina hainanensis TaxID=1578017 RepID=A0ABW5NEV2_9FLAO|nr:hypothetical protein [Aquimarina sp. TRL1]QKX07425.1 hypothetical protein HN014_21740 [Aquimarina sp. TRL1]